MITLKHLVTINTVDSSIVPSEAGGVPHKTKTGFSTFASDQFKNWVTLY